MEECSDIAGVNAPTIPINHDKLDKGTNGIKTILLSEVDNERLCAPWKHSLIIKLLGKQITHQYLREKIQKLWNPTEQFPLIDMGLDYFIVKFSKEENMNKVFYV
ncbi:hypothetical protein R3W88_008261 [Solanum pinnatisectum]|uniref:DUF4283 domain-containing protein n=1 Tax=Solanum pinnatisectum TaxID=50273 RepID=A0AAV9MAW3_9SOLN|nr:hypothetical protein R3W88_008261 [Solanum pinnatisectum]